MSEEEKFDVIIIGAGPAGLSCAYILAKEGKNVLVVERGDTPGCKNVTGGRLYTYALDMLLPGLSEEAALERKVTHEQIMMLDKDRSINIDYHEPSFNADGQTAMSYTVLRANFDQWLAGKAEETGAVIVCGIKVDDLIEEEGKIVGIIAGEDRMYADYVVAADGVNSFMAQKAGLIGDVKTENLGVGLKEVIELPAKTIEERFNLKPEEGAARMILGCTEGVNGGAFLYTNKNSISLGCVFVLKEMAHHKKSVHDIFQDLKTHPSIYPLLEGGKPVEYGAHLVPEAGYRGVPKKLYREGFLMVGDAAGFVINKGYTIRGIDLAILSGIAAAKAIILAADPADIGIAYSKELQNVKLMQTMKAAEGFTGILEISRLFSTYPKLAADVFQTLFTVSGEVPRSLKKDVMELSKKNGLSVWQLLQDVWKGVRSV